MGTRLRSRFGVMVTVGASLALGLAAPPGNAAESIESQYVAELRATVAQVTASADEVAALRTVGAGTIWARTATEINPDNRPAGPNETVVASDGHTDRTFNLDPTADFDADWPSPPATLAPGRDHRLTVSVAGRITGGTTVQGFRQHDAILLVNDRWDGSTAVGAGQNCVDPIGTQPISCTDPSDGSGPFTVRVPSSTSLESFSFGVAALNCSACYVRYTYTAMSGRELASGAGSRLLAAARRARAILRVYQRADTRHGTAEEHALVSQMLLSLRLAATSYGGLAGSPVRTTPRKLALARRLARGIADEAAAAAVARWPGIERVAALLENPRRADGVVAGEIRRRLAAGLRSRANAIARRALGDRLPLQLGVPIRTQVRNTAERFALERLGRMLFKLDKRGLLLQFFGKQVRIVLADIAQAARPTGNVQRRTDITLAGYQRRGAKLEALLPNTDSKLPTVAGALFEAQGALQAASFLRRDIEALVQRRCQNPAAQRCPGAQATRDRLAEADERLANLIGQTRTTFLIGREFDPAELRSWIAGLGRMQADLKRANRRIG